MADCDDTLRELYTYLDGELTSQTHDAIDSHLNGCMDCLQVYDFQAELRTVIARKAREQQVPPSLLRKVQDCFGLGEPGTFFPGTDR
jgi:anti-sigma factor (TIGR02949 family)